MKKQLLLASGMLLLSSAFAQAPTDDIIRFPFSNASLTNEGSTGSTNDLSNNTPITLTPVTDRDGYINSAVELGAGGGIGTQVAADLKDLTLGFWVNIPSSENTGSTRIIQAYGDAVGSSVGGFQINYDRSTDYLGFNVRAGNGAAYLGESFGDSVNLNDAAWHHIVMRTELVSGNLEVDVFIDGVENPDLSNQLIDMSSFNGGSVNRFLKNGNLALSPTGNFSHKFDDIKLFDRKLTATEVTAIYNEAGTEYIAPTQDTLYVNINATGNNDGSSWVDAFTDASSAFNTTTTGDQVWVAQGTYIRNTTNRDIVFGWIADSVSVFGGFSGNGTETSVSQRDWEAYPTIFSGDIGTLGSSSDNAYTVFTGPIGNVTGNGEIINYSLIDGIKITEGNANAGSYPGYGRCGAGIAITSNINKYVIRNVEIYNNSADHGAGIWRNQSSNMSLVLENVSIHHNGGGTAPVFEFRNSGGTFNIEMANCLIYKNEAKNSALTGSDYGAIGFLGASGGVHNFSAINCTFSENTKQTTDDSKGDIRTYKTNGTGNFKMKNCIMYNNASDKCITIKNFVNTENSWNSYDVINNILDNGTDIIITGVSNNLTSDPLFVDASTDDYSLQAASPAINAGTQTGVSVSVVDLAGNSRVFGSEIDMGAYEYGASAGPTTITEMDSYNITVYPNPTSSFISFEGIASSEVVNVSILNLNGQVVLMGNTVSNIDVSSLSPGLYVISVQSVRNTNSIRFIKK